MLDGLQAHSEWLTTTDAGRARSLARLGEAMHNQLRNALIDCALESMADQIEEAVLAVARREIDPYTAADDLVESFRTGCGATERFGAPGPHKG